MSTSETVLARLLVIADDRRYIRTTYDKLALDLGVSRSTVRRAIQQLANDQLIRFKVKDGNAGGLIVRVSTGSQPVHQPVHQPVQNEPVRDVVARTPSGSEGALAAGRALRLSTSSQPVHNAHNAYRPAKSEEIPESGAEYVYDGAYGQGNWFRQSETLWIAPNGDTVSRRSMTPGLRRWLRADEPYAALGLPEVAREVRSEHFPHADRFEEQGVRHDER